MATGGPLDSDGEQDPRIRADLDKEIQAAEETVQALRHSLLKAELRLKALRQRRNGAGGASHPAESQRSGMAPKEGLSSKLVGFGQLKGLGDWLAQQSNSLLQQAEAAGEQEAQLRTRRRQQLERQSEEQLQRDADAESERVVRQHALDFLDQTKATAPLVLLFMAILYGGNVPLLKTVELGAPLQLTGPELLALRFLTSTVVSVPFVVTNWRKVRAVLIPSVELAIWLFAGYVLQILGLEKTSASTCAVASALTGPFVQILELLVDGKQIAPFVALCSAGTFSGIALFVTAPSLTQVPPLFESIWNVLRQLEKQPAPLPHEVLLKDIPGENLAIAGAFLFAMHVYRSNKLLERGDPSGRVSSEDFAVGLASVQLVAAAVTCMVASSLDSPYSTAQQLRIAERLRPEIWEEILACGVLCTGLPAVVELFAFKYVGPAIASLIYCTIPLWGTVLSMIFLNEKLGPQAIFAAVIILLSSFAPSLLELQQDEQHKE